MHRLFYEAQNKKAKNNKQIRWKYKFNYNKVTVDKWQGNYWVYLVSYISLHYRAQNAPSTM